MCGEVWGGLAVEVHSITGRGPVGGAVSVRLTGLVSWPVSKAGAEWLGGVLQPLL